MRSDIWTLTCDSYNFPAAEPLPTRLPVHYSDVIYIVKSVCYMYQMVSTLVLVL